MRTLKRIPVTKEGLENLKKEYSALKASRPDAVNTLSEARRMGDLSENGLYTAAKMRLRGIDSQLYRLEMQIKLADVREIQKNIVGVGSEVKVFDGTKERDFLIVGDYEADPLNNKISIKSPIGKALFNKKVGDRVEVKTPSGATIYKILKIK